ncbi:DUF4249 family protein [bacterium]|nr:DUF4249 family protein [bacterium]
MKRIVFTGLLLLTACGEGKVSISELSYEPKIVFNAFITPGKAADDIRIQRNFPVGQDFNTDAQYLINALVTLTKVETNETITLVNNLNFPDNYFYDTTGTIIEYGKAYRLDVRAEIDGDTLHASSTTVTPNPGFQVVPEQSRLSPMHYVEKDSLTGEVKYFNVAFQRSPGTQFYVASMKSLAAAKSAFIYPPDNPFIPDKFDSSDVVKNLKELTTSSIWIQDTPLDNGISETVLDWFLFSFYGDYRLTVYAGDQNFRDFVETYDQVQDIDGNFYEPVFHIEGDGIGVFASYVADTTSFSILRPGEN